MKLAIMFIENKQSQHFGCHTYESLFLFPVRNIMPKYFKTCYTILGYYLFITTRSNFIRARKKIT